MKPAIWTRSLHLPAERLADLRHVTITALARPDLYTERTWGGLPEASYRVNMDDDLEVYAQTDTSGNCSIRRVGDNSEIHFLPAQVTETLKNCDILPFLSPDGRFAAVRQRQGRLQIWRLDGSTAEMWLEDSAVNWVHCRADGAAVALGHIGGAISVYDLVQRRRLHRLDPDGLTREIVVALHPTEPLVAVTSYYSDFMQVRDLRTGKVIKTLETPDGGYRVAWHPAGHMLAVNEGDHYTIRLYDRQTFELRGTVGPTGGGCCFYFNHAGDRLAAHSWKSTVQIFDVATGRLLFEVPFTQPTLDLHFSRDDRRLAGFVHGNQIGIWQVADGRVCQALQRPPDHPRQEEFGDLAVSPDGRLVAATIGSGIGIWDLQRRNLLALLPLQDPRFVRFALGPDGALLTGDRSGTYRWPLRRTTDLVHVWHLGPPVPLALPPGAFLTQTRDGHGLALSFRPVGP
jgi:WD40 repeat protein